MRIIRLFPHLALIFILLWLIVPTSVHALDLVMTSDTLSSQKLSSPANHFITFRTPSGVSSGTITLDFSHAISSTASVDHTDIDLSYGATTGEETQAILGSSAGLGGVWGVVVDSKQNKILFTYPKAGGTAIAPNDRVQIRIGNNTLFQATGDSQLINAATGKGALVLVTAGADVGSIPVSLIDDAGGVVVGDQHLPGQAENNENKASIVNQSEHVANNKVTQLPTWSSEINFFSTIKIIGLIIVLIAVLFLGWLRLKKKHTFSGVVFDVLTDDPLIGAEVTLFSAQAGGPTYQVLSDENGRFSFNTAPGNYTIYATKLNYTTPFSKTSPSKKYRFVRREYVLTSRLGEACIRVDIPLERRPLA